MRAHTQLRVLVVILLLTSTGSQSLANLSGSDDFNDNSRDTGKWYVEAPHLNETNERLEFTSTGSGDEDGIWVWIANEGSQNQSWSTTIDVHNETNPTEAAQFCAMGLFVVNSADDTDVFGIMLASIAYAGRGVMGGWDINGVDYFNLMITTPNTSVALKIDYDADTKELSCAYDTGSGYVTFTNFAVSAWSMSPADTFRVAIAGWTEISVAVSSGQVYADNFQASTASDISNHLYSVSIEPDISYRNPETAWDVTYKFLIDLQTDTTVTNVSVQCPAGNSFSITEGYPDGENLEWGYRETSSTPVFDQFGDGDYIITLTYQDGTDQTTVLPFTLEDGTTPIPDLSDRPEFTSPSPLHGALFVSPQPETLVWTNVDPNANVLVIRRWNPPSEKNEEFIGLYSDTFSGLEITGPLSTRVADSLSFSPTNWIIDIDAAYVLWGTNVDGVAYEFSKGVGDYSQFSVLDANDDYDGDGLLNGWEAQYFGGPTNAIASEDSDHDGQSNLDESISGMDPTSAASVFMITNAIPLIVQDYFVIEWPSIPGRIYNASWTTNLMDGFQSLESDILYPRNSYTDTVNGAEDSGFYQVEVELP